MAELPVFDQGFWSQEITRPDWYVDFHPRLQELREFLSNEGDNPEARALWNEVEDFFELALSQGRVALASSGPNLDELREATDTLVIHHMKAESGMRLTRLNAKQMLNLYVPYFVAPTTEARQWLRGQPLWSNHLREVMVNGVTTLQPVFWAYHWLRRRDGEYVRLLRRHEMGWHAGNLAINRRSEAICLDGDFNLQDPEPELLQDLGSFIVSQYPQVATDRIFGHGEVSRNPTTCPGVNFAGGWKVGLLESIRQAKF